MAIDVLIWRHMSEFQRVAAQPYLSQLASLAGRQPGYVAGRTLNRYDDPEEKLIICTWESLEDWERFNNLEESRRLHFMVDQIIVKPTKHTVFVNNTP